MTKMHDYRTIVVGTAKEQSATISAALIVVGRPAATRSRPAAHGASGRGLTGRAAPQLRRDAVR